ncbi:MAG: phosphodiesterase [Sphingomonadales bacterium]
MLIAQITDCHIGADKFAGLAGIDAVGNLRRCVDHIVRPLQAPDAVLATGDLVNCGRDDEYQTLRACLKPLTMPLYVIPGNHDARAGLRRAFADQPYLPPGSGPIHYALAIGGLRFIFLDSVAPGEEFGCLGEAQLAWLENCLAQAPDAPTVIVMHHPPFVIGLHRMDRINCRDGDALADMLTHHRQVVRVLCGHTHRFAQVDFAGSMGIAAPSTAAQLEVNLTAGARAGWSAEPPAYLLHQWRPDQGMITHLCQVLP